jgi:hypothetical protein
MVEFHAPPSVARGWFSPPFASREKRIQLPRGSIRCAINFLTIFALALLGSLLCRNTESLAKNLYFWSLLSLLSVLLTASHGGYGPKSRGRPKAQFGVAANCFLATSLAMLILAVVLEHPNILGRSRPVRHPAAACRHSHPASSQTRRWIIQSRYAGATGRML